MAVAWEQIDRLVKSHRAVDATSNEESLWRELRLWWCLKYSRPFKDPILQTYTLDELLYEYLTFFYLDPENDPRAIAETEKRKTDDEEWVKAQIAEMKKQVSIPKVEPTQEKKEPLNPTPNPVLPELPELSTRFDE